MTIKISYNPLVWSEGITNPDGQALTVEEFNLAKDASEKSILSVVRKYRNQLLQDCDWTQMPDVEISDEQKNSWSVYRQALRDFPETLNMNEPFTLTEDNFPQKPE